MSEGGKEGGRNFKLKYPDTFVRDLSSFAPADVKNGKKKSFQSGFTDFAGGQFGTG